MQKALMSAKRAALAAGEFLSGHFGKEHEVDASLHHDIKLALDRKSQDLITSILLEDFPEYALYGEEGIAGNQASDYQWIVDPIDGTVNFFYGIPHYCVSIALRYEQSMVLGVIYDPSMRELWEVEKGKKPLCNGEPISVSSREKLEESVLFVGCGKDEAALQTGLGRFGRASLRARKMRMMGSAALAMAYIAQGRLDAYIESRISLWDIAAGKLLVEEAGGQVILEPLDGEQEGYSIIASNGKLPLEDIL